MDDLVPITPVNFFQLSWECFYVPAGGMTSLKKHALPDLSDLCSEPYFAKVAMGWNKEGLEFFIEIGQPARRSNYPEVLRGDSVELFIDTRDVKTSGFNTRFCHHFFFLPEEVDGHVAGEITRFRTEDVHDLCSPKELRVKTLLKSHNYTLQIVIPAACLNGFDPEQFDRLGFAYRINRPDGPPQHFSAVTDDYGIDQQPSLWSSVKLVN